MPKVYSHENLTMVQTARGLLELNQIECYLKNEYHASGGHVGWTTLPVELWVRDVSQATQAVELLEEKLGEAQEGNAWVCAKCDEENAASFETCWKCQTARD